jgi:hypothetical protein
MSAYTKQYHRYQNLNLSTNTVAIPANGPNNVAGGAVGATVTIPALIGTYDGTNVTVPAVTVDVTGDPGATVVIPAQVVAATAVGQFTIPAQNNLVVVGGGGGTVTIPAYAAAAVRAPDNISLPMQVAAVFPVKKIKFNFSYAIKSVTVPIYIITSDIVNNDIVGVQNNYAFTDAAGNLWYVDPFKQDGVFEYIFRDPVMLNGNINLTFINQGVASQTITNTVVAHVECLGL